MLIMEKQSILMTSVEEKFRNESYEVFVANADIDKVSQIRENLSAIIIFADEKLIGEKAALNYIKDKIVEEDIPLFVIGNSEELSTIERIVPRHLFQQEFLRPINVNELVEVVDEFVKKNSADKKRKILVVDDSGTMLRSVKGWLEGSYQVALANSGAMAIKYLALNRPDLILLDYEMPVVDGKQVLEMIRSETEFTDIPVIFLTSKGDKESIMGVMDLKPAGYLLKTMMPDQIVKYINDFFEKKKAESLKRQ